MLILATLLLVVWSARVVTCCSWIDEHTRAVFVEFVVFNANVNLFGVSQIVVEFVQTGGGCDLASISSRSFLANNKYT